MNEQVMTENLDLERKDGKVIIDEKQLEAIIEERNTYLQDIQFAAQNIYDLLKVLDVIDKFGDFQKPSFGKLTSFATKVMMSDDPSKGELRFLTALKPTLEKYSELVKK